MNEKVRLRKTNEIDFNKANGSYHIGFEIAKQELGRKTYIIYKEYDFYGTIKVKLKDMNGNIVDNSTTRSVDYPESYFKKVK